MSDYDSIQTDADEERAYHKDLERHWRDGHMPGLNPTEAECLVCDAATDEGEEG